MSACSNGTHLSILGGQQTILQGRTGQNGTRYFAVDTDGNPTKLVPLLMEAGVDVLWPIERASDVSPMDLRREFGRDLRLWGGVDKRVLWLGRDASKAHLREIMPLIEEGGVGSITGHSGVGNAECFSTP